METGKLPFAPEWHFCRFFELSIATLKALSASASRIPHRDPHPSTRQDVPQVTVLLFLFLQAVLPHLFQNQALENDERNV